MQPRLFTSSQNERAEEFKRFLPVNINLRFETVAPYLILAEQNYIKPLLGSALFNILANAGNNNVPDHVEHLRDMVRMAEIRLALWKGFDTIHARISDTGIATDVEKDNRLFRYQEENLKRSLKNEGFDQLDSVLEYIEEHIDYFPAFQNSTYFTKSGQSLIRTTAEFNECYNIDHSRLVFLKMRPYIRDVERIALQHRVGIDFYEELLEADPAQEKYARILPMIRLYVVYRAVVDGIGELHKMPTEKGLVFETQNMDGVELNPVDADRLLQTRAQFAAKADRYLEAAIHVMERTPADYAAYFAFAGNSPADGVIHIDNTNRKTFLA